MPILEPNWLPVVNSENVPIPAFAAMAILGVDIATGSIIVGLPTRDGQTDLLFNGTTMIASWDGVSAMPSGEGHETFPTPAAYTYANEQNAQPVDGDIWGVVAGSWLLQKSRPGFRVIGDGANGVCMITRQTTAPVAFVRIDERIPGEWPLPSGCAVYDPVSQTWTDAEPCWYIDGNGD